jgi:hypothetical protein
MKRFYLLAVFIIFWGGSAYSQVAIYPKVVFVDPLSKASYIRLVNETDEPREVEIFTSFGFTDYDSLGTPMIREDDSIQKQYSLVPYLKVFPKRLVIMPKKNQIIRILVSHPLEIADGTYHSRFIVRSKSVVKQADTTAPTQVRTGVSFYSDVGTAVIYEKGHITTDLNIRDIQAETDTANVNLLLSVEKSGNSPFWGNAAWKIKNSSGETVVEQSEPVAFYNPATRRFVFKKTNFKPGAYKAEVVINTNRDDIPKERLIKKEEITKTFEFFVP